MTSFAKDIYRQVQERFEYEFSLVAKGHTAPDLVCFERVDSADGNSFEIHLTMYPPGFVIRIEDALDYKAALIGRIIESIEAFQKERK